MKFALLVPYMLPVLFLAACAAPAAQAPQPTYTPQATYTPQPTYTPPPTFTPVPTDPMPTALPERITDPLGNEMVLVPAGEFTRGSDEDWNDERPMHQVYVDAFYIDVLEVTNRRYQDCVEDGACQPPRRTDCCTEDPTKFPVWPEYFGNPEYDDYPVIFINWYDAFAYCEWRGARLATEAEWEKAARGTDARLYPWGNADPSPELLNYTWAWPGGRYPERPLYTTSPVGSYPAGASPYGVLDMAGNVYEWVYDRYDPAYYQITPYENPTGPEEGDFRVTRGGSFYNQEYRNRSSNRNNAYIPGESVHFDGGARCAADAG